MSFDYALAKELKDAGFPQPKIACHECSEGRAQYDDGSYSPTLEELIEACPKTIFSNDWRTDCNFELWWTPGLGWEAVYHWMDGTTEEKYDSSGATPTEALARLWLVLQKSKTPLRDAA